MQANKAVSQGRLCCGALSITQPCPMVQVWRAPGHRMGMQGLKSPPWVPQCGGTMPGAQLLWVLWQNPKELRLPPESHRYGWVINVYDGREKR